MAPDKGNEKQPQRNEYEDAALDGRSLVHRPHPEQYYSAEALYHADSSQDARSLPRFAREGRQRSQK